MGYFCQWYLSLVGLRELVRVFLRLVFFFPQLCGSVFLVQRYINQLLTLMSPALSVPIRAKDSGRARTAPSACGEYAADSFLPFRRWKNPGVE